MMLRLQSGPVEHDYTRSYWGHALHNPQMVEVPERPNGLLGRWFGAPVKRQELRCLGHGSVREGDTLLIGMESGRTARFLVCEISYFLDPGDMFDLKRADFVEYLASVDGHRMAEPPKSGFGRSLTSAVAESETPQ